jgi:glycosyltransferase involved in cell wall biosynthesis
VKLLLYSHAFPPSVGGVETIVSTLARGLTKSPATNAAKSIEVTVATQTAAQSFDDTSFPYRVVRRPSLWKLARLIAATDVIHIAGPAMSPMLLSWLLRKPYVVEHHGYQAICPNGILLERPQSVVCPGNFQAHRYRECIKCESQELSRLRSVTKMLLTIPRHFLAKRAAANIAVSQHVAKRIALPRTTVIYHGLDPISPPASQPAPNQSSAPARIRFGYVGRFVPEKGISVLIEAAQKLRRDRQDFEVVLIGDGPLRPQIEDSIRRAHSDAFIRITGFLHGDKLTEAVNSLDAVVMPSIWEETAGLAAIEQMARGRLVIVSDIGGLGEIVADAGLKFPAGDTTGLAARMQEVIQGGQQLSDLGKIAQTRARSKFLADRMVAEHAATWSRFA